MDFDPLLLSRVQFGFTISFHIVFPAFTIGLSAFIATLEGRALFSGDDHFHRIAKFWTKIFAVSFAMGVVSGLVLSYQFGTNWSRFSTVAGNVIGPLLGYEVLTAFFLEATFLGIMLFAGDRVPRWVHFLSCCVVAAGTCLSAFWILSANSWMQFPAGHEMRDGIAYPRDWLAIIFNPTFPYRFAHMVTACYLTTSFVVIAVAARYLLLGNFTAEARTMLRMGLGLALALAPAQILIGDLHGIATRDYQPAKLAAMEGHWDGKEPAALILFAWPDADAERNDYEVSIPRLGSLIVTHDWDGLFKGLKDFAKTDRPPLPQVFFAFRAMAGLGVVMLMLALAGGVLWWRGGLDTNRLFLRCASYSWPIGFVALLMGWMVTEIGRQPWLATGLIRTAAAVSPVTAEQVRISLLLFVLVYGVVFSAGIYYINSLIARGPSTAAKGDGGGVPTRPISAALDAGREALAEQE